MDWQIRRAALGGVFSVLAILALGGCAHGQTDLDVASRLKAAVVRIEASAEDTTADDLETRPSGVGIMVSRAGHVLTNAAGLGGCDAVVAVFSDGRRYSARISGTDIFSNLAVFKIDDPGFQLPAFGNGTTLRAGDAVYGLDPGAGGTREVVSSRVRDPARFAGSAHSPIGPYIEVEDENGFPIGPIFDSGGSVQGFVVLRSGPTSTTKFLLALPIEEVKRLADEMSESGKVRRSRIGLSIKQVPDDIAAARGLQPRAGTLIAEVETGSPAERGGLRVDDIILRIGRTTVRNPEDYVSALQRLRPGSRIAIQILRGKFLRVVTVTTGEIVPGPSAGELEATR